MIAFTYLTSTVILYKVIEFVLYTHGRRKTEVFTCLWIVRMQRWATNFSFSAPAKANQLEIWVRSICCLRFWSYEEATSGWIRISWCLCTNKSPLTTIILPHTNDIPRHYNPTRHHSVLYLYQQPQLLDLGLQGELSYL